MKTKLFTLLTALCLLFNKSSYGQIPNLGAASNFALFTNVGAVTNTGVSYILGDAGTNSGAYTGNPSVEGQVHVVDAISNQAAIDLNVAYGNMSSLTCGAVLGVALGNNQTLTPNIYCTGAASTLTGNLTLDGQGNPNAVFIFKVDGAFAATTNTNILLINSANLRNVYWQINGAFTLGNGSIFRGNLLVNGAITLNNNATIFGRALSKAGAININASRVIYYDGALWNGNVNTDFGVANNWTYGSVPSPGEHIGFVLAPTNHCLLDSNRLVGNITNPSDKNLNANGHELSVSGIINLSSSGKIVLSTVSSKISFVGTIAQNIPANTFTSNSISNLGINNSSGVSINGTLDLINSLKIQSGTLVTNNFLTLISTASNTATIDEIVSGSISGNIFAERYIPANGRKYRFLTSPVVGGTSMQWRDNAGTTGSRGTQITGSFGDVDVSTSNQSSAFVYDESDATGGNDINHPTKWNAIDGNTILTNGKGYRVFIRGDRTISLTTLNTVNNATTLWVNGTNPSASVSLPLSYTASASQGWNLVGNPYAGTIDWNQIKAQGGGNFSNVDDALYIFNPTNTTSSSGGYASYVNGVGTGTPYIGTPFISSWQGFFVKANAVGAAISIKENHKVSNTAGSSFFKTNLPKANSMHLKLLKDKTPLDDASIYMETRTTINFDNKFDAYDLTDKLGVITADGLNTLSISGLPLVNEPQKVMLSVKLSSGDYSFTFEDLTSFASGTQVYLTDKYLNKSMKLNNNDTYAFNVNESNPFTFGINRFELLFTNSSNGLLAALDNGNKMMVYPNPVKDILTINTNNELEDCNWIIYNVNGQIMKSGNGIASVFVINTSELVNGFYFIVLKTDNNTQVVRFVK